MRGVFDGVSSSRTRCHDVSISPCIGRKARKLYSSKPLDSFCIGRRPSKPRAQHYATIESSLLHV